MNKSDKMEEKKLYRQRYIADVYKDEIMKKAREKAEEVDNLEIVINARRSAEELDKFLQDRLSEDDFKKVAILLKDIVMLSTGNVKAELAITKYKEVV